MTQIIKSIGYLLLLLSVISINPLRAESILYVTDQVDIPLRSEKEFADNILRSVPSGAKLSVLQATEDGWTKVRFEQTSGWIISKYLTNNPAARETLEKLNQTHNNTKLLILEQKKTNLELQKEVKVLKENNDLLSVQINKLKAEKEHIEKVYEDALKLEHSNEKLSAEILRLKAEVQLLESTNRRQQDTSSRNWFIVGAIVLFFGLLTGIIITRFISRKRY